MAGAGRGAPGGIADLGEGGGVASPLGGRPGRGPSLVGCCLRAPKSNPPLRRPESLGRERVQPARQGELRRQVNPGARTCGHLQALPA